MLKPHDFYNRGGFYGQEDLFQKNVEKLLLEVERLEIIDSSSKNKFSDIRKNIDKYLSILANLATIGDLGRDALG